MFVNEHDEPVVVDNFPVRVDFGSSSSHPTKPNGKNWERDFSTDFHQLLVILEDKNGDRERHKVLRGIKGAASIDFDLVRESDSSQKESLKFALDSNGTGGMKLVMTPQVDDFEIDDSQAGRLKPKTMDDLRLVKVTVGGRNIPLKGGAFRRKVTVVIIGSPEA
jgi:hypothetical protein